MNEAQQIDHPSRTLEDNRAENNYVAYDNPDQEISIGSFISNRAGDYSCDILAKNIAVVCLIISSLESFGLISLLEISKQPNVDSVA